MNWSPDCNRIVGVNLGRREADDPGYRKYYMAGWMYIKFRDQDSMCKWYHEFQGKTCVDRFGGSRILDITISRDDMLSTNPRRAGHRLEPRGYSEIFKYTPMEVEGVPSWWCRSMDMSSSRR